MDRHPKELELNRLRGEVRRLEEELGREDSADGWPPRGFYFTYHVVVGSFLGLFGAATSLLLNIIGALVVAPPANLAAHPLNLIRVYLTFPLGDAALETEGGVALAIGCCLYLATGMLLGIPFQLVLSRWAPEAGLGGRLALATLLSVGLWLFNFYGVLSWLQPLLFRGRWIVELIPPWVAAATHLIFGWTMALLYPLGRFTAYQPPE